MHSLMELAKKYFRKKGYKVEGNVSLEGFSGLTRKFDLLIRRGNERRVVWTKDWNRTVGVNIVISCLLYTSPSPRDGLLSRMPSSA